MAVFSKIQLCVAATTLAVTCVVTGVYLYKRFKTRRTLPATEAFKLDIHVVTKSQECEPLIYELRRRSMAYGFNSIGFDCEWVTRGSRRPVSLLQLSSYDGFCVLIRLNLLDSFPPSLTQLLEDISIYKVGVAPVDDANYLYNDHGIVTSSTLDLRHFAELCGHKVGGLAHLSEMLLGVVLDKSLKLRCGNWDADILTPAQLHYAASDAHAAIRIFVKLIDQLDHPSLRGAWTVDCDENIWSVLDDVCSKYTDFSYKQTHQNRIQGGMSKKTKLKEPSLHKKYSLSARSKPLYHNCFLQAPDGELLCTIDNKKALWYVDKGLADLIQNEPLVVRLKFEPAGRSVGDVGKYYQLQKVNQCVVCGATDSYHRKNVVPREYRKYFPEVMKDHSSHDVVLLCAVCHQRSNVRDQPLRVRLGRDAGAPLDQLHLNRTEIELPVAKKVRMAARALLHDGVKHKIPDARKRELAAVILSYYTDHEEITEELLQEASKCTILVSNDNYVETHGLAVVKYFLKEVPGGLLKLEEIWRTHFLTSMRPRHMPELWSLRHSEDRLRVRWDEGRLTKKELQSVGIDDW